MDKIKRLSKKKHYDIIFFDINGECCGTVENVTGVENQYDINDYAFKVCSKAPKKVIVTNTDGTESGRWSLSIVWGYREF